MKTQLRSLAARLLALVCVAALIPVGMVSGASDAFLTVDSAGIGRYILSDSEAEAVSLTKAEVQNGRITVSGMTNPGTDVALQVVPAQATGLELFTGLLAYETVTADRDTGAFSMSVVCGIDVTVDTTYAVSLRTAGLTEPVKKYFKVVAPETHTVTITPNPVRETNFDVANTGDNEIKLAAELAGERKMDSVSFHKMEKDANGVWQKVRDENGKVVIEEEKIERVAGYQFGSDKVQIRIGQIGAAFAGLSHIVAPLNDAPARRATEYDKATWETHDYTDESGTVQLTKEQLLEKYREYLAGDNEYYSFTADAAGTVYYASPCESDTNFSADKGWTKLTVNTPLPEGYSSWSTVEMGYQDPQSPYQLNKVQYDGHDTVIVEHPYVYYKSFEAGESVSIRTPGVNGAGENYYETGKVLIKWGEHSSTDTSASIRFDTTTKQLEQTDEPQRIGVPEDKTITLSAVTGDPNARVTFSQDTIEQGSYPANVTMTVEASAGNYQVYNLNFEVHEASANIMELQYSVGSQVYDVSGFSPSDGSGEYRVDFPSRYTDAEGNEVAVNLPKGTNTVTLMKPETADLDATVTLEPADGVIELTEGKGTGTVRVLSSDGVTENTYTINFISPIYDLQSQGTAVLKTIAEGKTSCYDTYSTGEELGDQTAGKFNSGKIPDSFVGAITIARSKFDAADPTSNMPFYVGDFDGANGQYWISFKLAEPATVYIIDIEGKGWPNADKDFWTLSEETCSINGENDMYEHHFQAGETVNIPNYGFDETWKAEGDPPTRIFWNPSAYVVVPDSAKEAELFSIQYSYDLNGETISASCEIGDAAVPDDDVYRYSVTGLPQGATNIRITDVDAGAAEAQIGEVGAELATGRRVGLVELTPRSGTQTVTYAIRFEGINEFTEFDYHGRQFGTGTFAFQTIHRVPQSSVDDGTAKPTWYYSDYIYQTAGDDNTWGNQTWCILTTEKTDAMFENGTQILRAKSDAGSTPTKDGDFFSSKYDGTNNNYWMTFTASSAGTLFVGDITPNRDSDAPVSTSFKSANRGFWPNKGEDWNEFKQDGLNVKAKLYYYRHFEAGETVYVPNWGYDPAWEADPSNPGRVTKDPPAYTVLWDSDLQYNASIEQDTLIMGKDDTLSVVTTDKAGEPVDKDYRFYITNGYDRAAVNKDTGAINAISAGTITVAAVATDGTIWTSREITILDSEPVPEIVIHSDASSITEKGGTLQLTAELINCEPDDSVTWSVIYGPEIVTVDDSGLVTALLDGIATVKASLKSDPAVYATKSVVVSTEVFTNGVTLDVSALGGSIVNITDGRQEVWGDKISRDFAQGSTFTLKAEPVDGSRFMFWQDANSGRVISAEPTYTFTLGTDTALTAVFASKDDYRVIFCDRNDAILTEGSTADSSLRVPNDPFAVGYEFRGWMKDGALQALKAGDPIDLADSQADALYLAGYVRTAEKYLVTILDADIGSGEYQYNDKITLHPETPPAGKVFGYWMKDNNIVSYEEEYSFYVAAHNTTVQAIFVDESTPVSPKPLIVMEDPFWSAADKISFLAERTLPDEYTLISTGIILSAQEPDLKLTTPGILKSESLSKENNGQYTVRKGNVGEDDTWYARAYMIYQDGEETVTIYSDTVIGGRLPTDEGGIDEGTDVQ